MFTKASFTKVDWLNLCRLTGVGPGVSSLHECVEAQVLVCSCMTRLSPHQPCYQSMRCSSSLLLPLSCGLQFGGYSGITLNAFGEMSKDFMVDPNFNVQTGCQEISGGNRLSRKEQPLYTKKIIPIDTENEIQRKKEIRWEKNQLDEDEANVDEEIAWLEEEFRLAAKEEEEEEEEDVEEEEEDVAGIAGLEEEENMEEDLAEEEDAGLEEEENMEEYLAEEEDVIEEDVEEEERRRSQRCGRGGICAQ